jgi:hypothetical protein
MAAGAPPRRWVRGKRLRTGALAVLTRLTTGAMSRRAGRPPGCGAAPGREDCGSGMVPRVASWQAVSTSKQGFPGLKLW